MNRKKDIILTLAGILIGLALGGPVATAALTAAPSSHRIYVDGSEVRMEAYAISGSNYVKLRDIGQAVGFNVYWDGSVQIQANAPYTGEAPAQTDANMDLRLEMVRRINQVRAENGVPPLTVNNALMAAAQDCAAQRFTAHDTPYECKTALACGYPHGFACNLTAFSAVARENAVRRAVDNWIKSPGHFQTMIDPRYDTIGTGVIMDGGRTYCYMFVGDPNAHNPYAP